MVLQINGKSRTIDLNPPATLDQVLDHLNIQTDRVAVEHNGEIAPRKSWVTLNLSENDRLEIVHFVGGGSQDSETPPISHIR